MFQIREAIEEDREGALRVLWKAFEAFRDLEEMKKDDWTKYWNRPEDEDWAYVAVQDEEVRACISFFASERNVIRGNPLRFGGVWGVGTEPQYRKQGMIKALVAKSFSRMRKEGILLSILDPFFPPFYEKFGYAIAESRVVHTFKHDNLREFKGADDISTRVLTDVAESEKLLKLQESMSRFGSRAFFLQKSMENMIKRDHYHILERNGDPVGEIRFRYKKVDDWEFTLIIDTTSYTSIDVLPSIVELVARYSINARDVKWYADPEVPITYFMKDPEDAPTTPAGRMMMRVIDFLGYCSGIRVPMQATDSIVVELKDLQCKWNSGTYRISPAGGDLSAEKVNSEPDVVLDSLQLSQVISGRTPATMLLGVGQIDCSKDTAIKLEAIFPKQTFVSYQRF
ncbi:MAG: GNAT family N-acetyltransferase [Candidatus Thorarchaeota archaeon]|jgi:predicted acetyltransferase